MIEEITPPPSEAYTPRTRLRLWRNGTTYGFGLVASTTAVGAAAGTIGAVAGLSVLSGVSYNHLWVGGIAVLALGYSLHEVAIIRLPTLEIRWQVPAHWRLYGKPVQLLLYGLVLGAEVFTFIPYTSFYLLLLLEASLGTAGGAGLGLVYGLARLTPTAAGIISSCRRGDNIPVVTRIMGSSSLFHAVNGLALVLVACVLMASLLTTP